MSPDDVAALRARLGYSQEEFGDRLGVSQTTIAALERGTTRITRLIENALRWLDHVNGAPPEGVCRTCDGTGTVRRIDRDRPHLAPRVRCEACDGQGVAPRHLEMAL